MVPIHLTLVHYLFTLQLAILQKMTLFSLLVLMLKSLHEPETIWVIFLNTPHRAGINRRSEALSACPDKSFEGNQSFPRISKRQLKRYEIDLATPMRKKFDNMDKIRGKLSQFLLI